MSSSDSNANPDIGGTISGPGQFVSGTTEGVYVAVFTFFLIWFIHLLLLPIVRRFYKQKAQGGRITGADKLVDGTRAARDAVIILLGQAAVNTAGHGVTSGVNTLQWINFALLLLWNLMFLIWYHPLLDFLLITPVAVSTVINWALAYRNA